MKFTLYPLFWLSIDSADLHLHSPFNKIKLHHFGILIHILSWKHKFVMITENFWRIFWRDNWRSIISAVENFRKSLPGFFLLSCVPSDQCEDVKGAEADFICDDPARPTCCFKSRISMKPKPEPKIEPKIDQNKPISQPETNIYKKYTYKIISSEDKIIFPVETFKWKKPKNNHYVPERNIKVSAQQSQNSNVCIMSFPQGLKWWI